MSEGRYFYKRGIGYRLEIGKGWGLGLALCHFENHASLQIMPLYGNIFIRLPNCFHRDVRGDQLMASYGFTWRFGKYDMGRDLHLSWGNKYKIIHMPWSYDFIRHDVLMQDYTWKRVGKGGLGAGIDAMPWNWPDKWLQTHDYSYTLRSGAVQNRKATIGVEEREFRQKWLKWCPLLAMVHRTIDVKFDGEVGERSGSWKGGTIGCGYDLLPNETPLECLRRMERERKFT